MYMDFNFDKDDLIFTTDKDGNLRGGGFKIRSDLLNDTVNNSNNSNNSNNINNINNINIQNGGKKEDIEETLKSLKDLAIPTGLFFTQNTNQNTNNNIRYEYNDKPIDENIYEKLLELVEPEKRKLHGGKTRSKREKKGKKTRKKKY